MGFYAGVLVGLALALLAVALTLGVGLVMWRAFWDGRLGHLWIEDWNETLRRWRFWK